MSLITRCTACETLFRVVPDQLRVSDGWVRCGQCGEIFDGAANLVEGSLPASLAATDVDRSRALTSTATAEALEAPGGLSLEATTASDATAAASKDAASKLAGEPEPAQAQGERAAPPAFDAETGLRAANRASAGERWPDDEIAAAPRAMPTGIDIALPALSPSPAEVHRTLEPSTTSDAFGEQAPSFMREGAPPSRWDRPLVRASLAGVSILLFVALTAQVARHERDRLAAQAPGWRPALAQLCAWTGCRVEAPRQIDSVVIDSSTFTRVRSDVYQLSFSLRNGAPVDLAMPSVELSVTNSQDQALARRILDPADMGASVPALIAGTDWSARITLQVRTATASDRVAGYRLLAFYP